MRMWRATSLGIIVGGVLSFSLAFMFADAQAADRSPKQAVAAAEAADTPAPPAVEVSPEPSATPPPTHPSFGPLDQAVAGIVAASGGEVGVSLIELGGAAPSVWSSRGAAPMDAASTYKLPALMAEAQLVAEKKINPAGTVCFEDSDWEEGWYDDYAAGDCYSRNVLASRAGIDSDNTAGHMLVRDVGGAGALNAWVAALGATGSSFFDGNTTTATDLTALWVAEAQGRLGGAAAQAWLYPLLTRTSFESGIPAGTSGATVVHKTGALDLTENDTALLLGAPSGPYVLTVLTDGLDETAGPTLIASIARAVETFESARSAPQ